MTVDLVEQAREIAEELLSESLPRRWAHVQAVGAQAGRTARQLLPPDEAVIVEAAGWLHDIGYAPALATTGFHPLDGARWLRAQGIHDDVVDLVAHHTNAILEAELRDLDGPLRTEFPGGLNPSRARDIVWYADLTTGPDGIHLTVAGRITEIRARYGPDHLVTRFITAAEPELVAAATRVEADLARSAEHHQVRCVAVSPGQS